MGRRTVLSLLLLLSFVFAGCGGGSDNGAGAGAPQTTATPASSPATTTAASGPKSAARWETVTTFNGSGAFQTPEFTIQPNAIQWRVRVTCAAGTIRINSNPPPKRPGAVLAMACPKEDTGYSIVTGPVRMQIEATGTWKAVVDQQVDTPLDEPLLAGMTPDRLVSQGSFYKVEVRGEGTARLYRLADGKRVLRFENFQTGENTDLFVWVSELAKPTTSEQAVTSAHVELTNLKSTLGNQNYEIPANIPTERIKSVVIWCQPVQIAYAAVALS